VQVKVNKDNFLPVRERLNARFAATKLLPSPGTLDVTRSFFGTWADTEEGRETLILRNSSAMNF
jgi:hypothetical protein